MRRQTEQSWKPTPSSWKKMVNKRNGLQLCCRERRKMEKEEAGGASEPLASAIVAVYLAAVPFRNTWLLFSLTACRKVAQELH